MTLKLFLFLPLLSFAQSGSEVFSKLSRPEKCWVVFHPFIAKKAYIISLEARNISRTLEKDSTLDHDADGGRVDAFRHAYWMARLAQEIGWRKARKLGNAHERGNYLDFKRNISGEEIFSDSAASAMDLFNNQAGIEIGMKNKNLDPSALQKLIIEKILEGGMLIILKDADGNSLRCDGQKIEPGDHSRIWNISRCLVSSEKK